MKKPASPRPRRADRQRITLRVNPIAAACSTLLFASVAAYAQTATTDLNTVTVTGIRRGIESSIAVKRESDSIVEAISAEDIGKLPDVSIAESLARLPGLTAQRVDGRASLISIRGLSGDFASTLLNGREVVSTGDNRSVEYDQFPSELINGAIVYKTPDASLMGQGLSGTVNLKTIRPLDFKGRQIAVNLRGEQNSNGALNGNSTANGNRFSFAYIDQFANNTVGVAVGFAHLDSPLQQKHYKAWWWDPGATSFTQPATGPKAYGMGGFEAGADTSSQKRDGLMAVFEFKPNKDVHSVVDLYYSQFSTKKFTNMLLANNFNVWNGSYTGLTSSGGIVNSGTFQGNQKSDVYIQQENLTQREDRLFSAGWKTDLKINSDWTAVADLSYSSAKRDEKKYEVTGQPNNTGSMAFNLLPNGGGFPTFAYTGDSLSNPLFNPLKQTWGRVGGLWAPNIKDELTSARLEGKRYLEGMFSSLDVGLNFTNRKKTRNYTENFFVLPTGTSTQAVSNDMLYGATNMGFVGLPNLLAFDPVAALNKFGVYQANVDDATFGRRWTVNENITTAFAKLNIDTVLGKTPIRGNMGLQVINSKQASDGFDVGRTASGAPVAQAVNRGASYTDFLPSLNLNADMGADRYVRFGVARTTARPRMDDMRAFNSAGLADKGVDVSTGKHVYLFDGNGGNAQLKPWVADGVDLSFEKYFGKRSYVAVAGFYKELRNYIYNQTLVIDYTGFPNQTGNTPTSNLGTFTRPMNGQGGRVQGVEFSASLEGNLLTPMLEGFGVQVSATDTVSGIRPDGPTGIVKPLEGMSGQTTGLTLYYEQSGFSARVAQRHRSPFTAQVVGLFANKTTTTNRSDDIVDLQLGYTFNSGTYKGLGLLFQVNNLTDAAYETYQTVGGNKLPETYNKNGRQFLFGINYKM